MDKVIELNHENSLPLVSVALTTYNGEKFLRQQLNSIYSQTYKNIEVVVTDDCSNDRTVEILEEYKQKYGLIYFVNDKNLGFVKNFERAISLCKGEYIALSDQDDVWKPEKIEALVNEIGNYTLIYAPAFKDMLNDGSLVKCPGIDFYLDFCTRFGSGKPTKRLIACNWVVSHQILFKRELSEFALPIPVGQRYHDAWLAIVASKLSGIKFLNQGLMYYRKHPASVTYSGSHELKPKFLRLLQGLNQKDLRIKGIESEIHRLRGMLAVPFLDKSDKQFIQDLIYCHQSRLKFGFRIKSFWIALRYVNLVFIQGKLSKFIFLITALIGQI